VIDVSQRLEEIGRAIEQGVDPSFFKAEMDQLLGTEMEERDELVEAHWEESYRNHEE
jgi:hypothetical protein